MQCKGSPFRHVNKSCCYSNKEPQCYRHYHSECYASQLKEVTYIAVCALLVSFACSTLQLSTRVFYVYRRFLLALIRSVAFHAVNYFRCANFDTHERRNWRLCHRQSLRGNFIPVNSCNLLRIKWLRLRKFWTWCKSEQPLQGWLLWVSS